MKKFLVLVLSVALLNWAAAAQSATGQAQGSSTTGASAPAGSTSADTTTAANAAAEQGSANAGLASGTTINAKLTKSLDSKKAKVGDPVEAKTTSDVKAEGKTVLPKGSKLLGKVTQASARANGDAQSAITIVFDRALPKGGGPEMPLNLTIRALAAAQSVASASHDDMMGSAGSSGSASGSGGMARPGGSAGGGGGLGSTVGGVGSTAGGVIGGAGSTAGSTLGSTTGAVGSTVGGAAGSTGASATGTLESNARGAIGLPGITLQQSTSATQGATLSSSDKNVHLDGGTQLVLEVTAAPNQ